MWFSIEAKRNNQRKGLVASFAFVCLVDGFFFGVRSTAITPLATDCLLVFQVNCKQFRSGNKRLMLAKSVKLMCVCVFSCRRGLTNPHKITYIATVKCANELLIETLNETCIWNAPQNCITLCEHQRCARDIENAVSDAFRWVWEREMYVCAMRWAHQRNSRPSANWK